MKYLLPPETPKGQSEAVNADEKLITVGAGAGTGKTWVLSQRYLRLLIDNPEILPQDILTLTYTEAAAEEMKERIQNLIRNELTRFDDEERRREIEDGLSDLWISTIHSFSARLIRESGLKLDIDPMASVITMHQEQNFWEDIKNAVEFSRLKELARSYGDKKLQELAKELDDNEYFSAAVSKWKSENLSAFAERVSELHSSSGFDWEKMLEWSENDTLIDDTRPLIEEILIPEWRAVWDIWKNITLPKAKNPNGPGGKLNALLAWQETKSPDKESLQYFYERIMASDYIKTPGGKQTEPFVSLRLELGDTLGKWRETRPKNIYEITSYFDKNFSEHELKMRKVLMKFCALSWGMWSMMKQRRGFLSFPDMISHAKTIITSGGINRTFKHILVDEFQDTDPLQFEMIEELHRKSDDTGLFAVGDPKQSIYKFRHADPSLFAETIDKADTKIDLDTSFRTRESLLERINALFKSIWPDGLGNSETMKKLTFEPLRAADNKPERDSGIKPEFRIILARNQERKAEQARKNLAEVLAREIARYVHEGAKVWDKETNQLRKVKFSDFAILSRSRSCFDILEDALEAHGIKSVRDKSSEYFSRGEINDIVCMLRAAADVNDSFALTGWLMSPFSGVKEEDAVKSFLEELNRSEQKPSELLKANLPDAYSRLEYLSLVGELEGPAGLLYVYDRNRNWLSCYGPNDRLRVLRNFRYAISIAKDFQSTGTSGLIACAEWLTRAVRNELSIEEPAWHDKDENAVRLGAVHSAKGLEYPITIIFEHRTGKNTDRDSLRPSKNLGLVFSDLPDEVKKGEDIKPQGISWEKLLSEQGDSEEETRLFYVAATRAQDCLIFCGLVDKDEHAYKDTWTKLMLDNVKDVKHEYTDDFDDSDVPEAAADESQESKCILDVVNVKNSLRQISATSFALFEFCPFAWRRSYRQGLNLTWELNVHDDEDDSGGADLGSLAHWVLSQWPKEDDYVSELDTLLNDRRTFERLPVSLRGAWRNEKGRRNLHEWLKRFSEMELFMKLKNESVRREYRFRFKLNESTALAGAIDAFYGNHIIDYKITSIDSAPRGLYESQLDFYALVIHELFGYESVDTSVVFLREGRIAERVCDDFDSIRERITNAAEICVSGPYNANIKNCSICPFKKGCVKYEG